MQAYEQGVFAYHATMHTESLVTIRDIMQKTEAYGSDAVHREQLTWGASHATR